VKKMEDLIKAIQAGVISGDKDEVETKVQQALQSNLQAEDILSNGLIAAMKEVGDRFEAGDFYVPEMLIAARAMQSGLALLKPMLLESGIQSMGKVVIGTVKGDLHDIGKNLVAMMLEGAGFEIIDLGTDVSVEKFVSAAKEQRANLMGMSALLTTTMGNMKAVVSGLKEAGIREDVKVMIGGAPVTEAYAKEIGADGFAPDASRAVSLAKMLTGAN
jgi:5-methyltetrahydrofolate--homocysteine methyltransferase